MFCVLVAVGVAGCNVLMEKSSRQYLVKSNGSYVKWIYNSSSKAEHLSWTKCDSMEEEEKEVAMQTDPASHLSVKASAFDFWILSWKSNAVYSTARFKKGLTRLVLAGF